MPLPSSGHITLNQIKAEFGGNGSLRAYFRGGGLVPDIPQNAAVPTSGHISVRHFLGATNIQPLTVGANDVNAQVPEGQEAAGVSTAVASGGTGSYTYSWVHTGGWPTLQGATNGQSAFFSNQGTGTRDSTYQVTVTSGGQQATASIFVYLVTGNPV